MNRPTLIIGIGALWLTAMGVAGYAYEIAPAPALEQADDALQLAAARDDRKGFGSAMAQLDRLSPGLAALRRYENMGTAFLPVPAGQLAAAREKARQAVMRYPAQRIDAQRIYASELANRSATAARGLALLQQLAAGGDTAATAMLAGSLEEINIRRDEIGPLWRSIALKRSQAALNTADFLSSQPRQSFSSYEARDYRAIAERLMRREAADGNIVALVSLGDLLRERGGKDDIANAKRYYERALAGGSVRAMVRLAELLLRPGFTPDDASRAQALLRRAVVKGSSSAAYTMAENYRLGRGLRVDNTRAYRYYLLAARGGSAGAQVRLGDFEAFGVLGPANPAKAFEWYKRGAAAGSAAAYAKVAQAYLPGGSMPQDNILAVDNFIAAAKRGSVPAMARLADIYRQGRITDRDIEQSNEWALRAVNAGSTNNKLRIIAAQAAVVGGMTPSEVDRAKALLNQAIVGGSVEARTRLGGLLLSIGDPESTKQALAEFKLAAASGNGEALASLAAVYASGNGVPVNPELSFQYYQLAASRGNASGLRGLGVAYASGFGTAKDMAKAMDYYQRASALGDIRASILLAGCYIDGCGAAPQIAKGNALIASVFGRGNNDIDFQTAVLMLNGDVPGSEPQALQILKDAARRGSGPARQLLLKMGQFDPRKQQKVDQQRRETLLIAGGQ